MEAASKSEHEESKKDNSSGQIESFSNRMIGNNGNSLYGHLRISTLFYLGYHFEKQTLL